MADVLERLHLRETEGAATLGELAAIDEIERLNGIYQSAVKGRADFRDALVKEREKSVRLIKALAQFADHKNWIDKPGQLQWFAKRHAIDFAQSVLDEYKEVVP